MRSESLYPPTFKAFAWKTPPAWPSQLVLKFERISRRWSFKKFFRINFNVSWFKSSACAALLIEELGFSQKYSSTSTISFQFFLYAMVLANHGCELLIRRVQQNFQSLCKINKIVSRHSPKIIGFSEWFHWLLNVPQTCFEKLETLQYISCP